MAEIQKDIELKQGMSKKNQNHHDYWDCSAVICHRCRCLLVAV